MGPQPKRCHHCKSDGHLIADCPTRVKKGSDAGDDSLSSDNKSDGHQSPDMVSADDGGKE
jgi:protein lin-28